MTFPASSVAWRGWGYGAGRTLVSRGWFVPEEPSPPIPTPSTKKPRRRRPIIRSRGGGGGGGGGSHSIRLEPPKVYVHFTDLDIEPEESDYALMHVSAPGVPVKALADGTIETFIDEKGRTSIVLSNDDGTRYWYADVGMSMFTNGARVRAGQPIARTKPGAAPVPPSLVLQGGARAALPSPRQPPPKPAQIVFVETPVPPPPRKLFKLVPIPALPAPPKEWTVSAPPAPLRSTAIAYVASIGTLIALLFALSQAPKKSKRQKRKK